MSVWLLSRFFSLSFSFQKFNYDVLPLISLGLSFWGFTQLLESVVLCFVPSFGKFLALCLCTLFQFLALYWDFVVVGQVPRLCFFHYVFSLF